MKILGMISGTSFDGIDYFVGDFAIDGPVITMTRIDAGSTRYPDSLHARLVKALPPAATSALDMCVIDTLVGQAFAQTAQEVAARNPGVELVVSHGQTIYHWIDDSGRAQGTLQMGNPSWIAENTGLPVVSDVRSRDVAVGGQGAPLVSLLDVLLLGQSSRRVGALNLGGISNITVAGGGEDPVAYDIGPANALLDAVIQRVTSGRLSYDQDSAMARLGEVNTEWLAEFLAEPYYVQEPPKSTGKELFNLDYVERITGPATEGRAPDLLATLTELTCVTVMNEVRALNLDVLYLAGGGTANPLMMERMKALSGDTAVELMSTLGVDPREKEPALFALIGLLTIHGLPGNVPSCTGAAGPRILGSITPGRGPLTLPPIHSEPITQLVIA